MRDFLQMRVRGLGRRAVLAARDVKSRVGAPTAYSWDRQRGIRNLIRKYQHIREGFRHRKLILNWSAVAFARGQLTYCRNHGVLRLSSGCRLVLSHSSDAWTVVQVFGRNDYRVQAVELWRTVVDIGANIGTFSVLAARAAPGVRLYCYEPSPDACRLLRHNLALNGIEHASVVQRAVAASPGHVSLVSPVQSSMRSILGRRPGAAGDIVKVEAVTLASLFDEHGITTCDFLKMDCEGAEYEILRTCPRDILTRVERIAVEFHEWRPDQDHRELANVLRCNGFVVDIAYDRCDASTGYIFGDRDPNRYRLCAEGNV